jgi:hypothetical protein
MTASFENLQSLRAHVANELRMPVPPGVEWLAQQLVEVHSETVLGVIFYGSCLRSDTDDGIVDFWVVVDDYRAAYSRPWHAGINLVAPPNVFYVEYEHEGRTLRTKYGVIDRDSFEQGTSFGAWHPYIWARFAQPSRLLACRDEAAREFFVKAVSNSILAMVGRLVCFLPARGNSIRFSLSALWQEAFRRTYDSERRPEADDGIRGLYFYDTKRYDTVAAYALQHLSSINYFEEATAHPRSFEVVLPESAQQKGRLRWRFMRFYARFLGLVRLSKTALTFGDWVPYVLWKLERHTGRRIELSERQHNHPLIFAWPIIIPLLFRRNLR